MFRASLSCTLPCGKWPMVTLVTLRPAYKMLCARFFHPIKNDDTRLDFYTVYKREAMEYDTDYVKKYDEDLNTTLIFVRVLPLRTLTHLTRSRRPACSLPSAQRSSSMSIRSSSLIRTSNLQPSSAPSSSLSISPPSQAKPPPFRLLRKTHPARSSPSLSSCMRVS
jgi:hypothetical protein